MQRQDLVRRADDEGRAHPGGVGREAVRVDLVGGEPRGDAVEELCAGAVSL